MAAKVGLSTVSYGIGVQNRYSAFLDDEEGFATSPAIVHAKRAEQAATKQKSPPSQASTRASNTNPPKSNGQRAGAIKLEAHQKNVQFEGQRQRNQDVAAKRQQRWSGQQIGTTNSFVPAQNKQASSNFKSGNFNQDNTANNSNNRFARNQSSTNHHQSNHSSHNQQQNFANKENGEVGQQHGKFSRNIQQNNGNQRMNNRRQYRLDDKKVGQPGEDVIVNNSIAGQSNEEEKQRRQQKRVTDLKYKDPEKREARRQQTVASSEQPTSNNQVDGTSVDNNAFNPRGGPRRNRRQFNDVNNNKDEVGRNPTGPGGPKGRGRRPDSEFNVDRRDGQQDSGGRGPRNSDRPQRNRNGFGAGSRGSRGSRHDDQGKMERQKPIPNFSDKSDFPSLAS